VPKIVEQINELNNMKSSVDETFSAGSNCIYQKVASILNLVVIVHKHGRAALQAISRR